MTGAALAVAWLVAMAPGGHGQDDMTMGTMRRRIRYEFPLVEQGACVDYTEHLRRQAA